MRILQRFNLTGDFDRPICEPFSYGLWIHSIQPFFPIAATNRVLLTEDNQRPSSSIMVTMKISFRHVELEMYKA